MASMNSTHFEDFTIVWLDNAIQNKDVVCSQHRNSLQKYVNLIRIFIDSKECQEYIKTVHEERIFFIVSGSLGEHVVPHIHDLPQVAYIYVFCADTVKHREWCKQYVKIHGVFDDENLVICQLRDDVRTLSNSIISMEIFSVGERSLQNLTIEQATFMWYYLLIEVLLHLPQTLNSKKEMINECRASYEGNKAQLKKIAEFEETYDATEAIRWYTKDTFVYRLFNKAFRTQNMDIIIKYRFYLVDLFTQLATLHSSQFQNNETFVVYRGQHMHIEELEKFRQSQGHLVSINTFFSTSKIYMVAAGFCIDDPQLQSDFRSVIFEIEVDSSAHRRPFAQISHDSAMEDEEEILFSMCSVFRIESVEPDDIWYIKLKLTDEMSDELTNLLTFYQAEHIGENPSIVLFGLFLSNKGALDEAENFYYRLLEELPEDHGDFGVIYLNLGEVLRHQGYLQLAELHFRHALSIFEKTVSEFHPYCAVAYSNLGSLYSSNGQSQIALDHYRRSLSILEEYMKDNPDKLLSTIYYGMAVAYHDLGEKKTAFTWYSKALEIEEVTLPKNHPSLAMSYLSLATLNYQSGNAINAREQFEKSLSILDGSLPKNHPERAVALMRFGDFLLEVKRDAVEALRYYQKAEQILDQTAMAPGSYIRRQLYEGLAMCYAQNKAHKLAIRNYDKFIDELTISAPYDLLQIGRCFLQTSISVFNIGDSSNAFKLLMLASACADKVPRTTRSVLLCRDIANEIRRTEHYELARIHYDKLLSTEVDHSMTRPNFIATLYNSLGATNQDLKDHQKALFNYKKALEYFMNDPITSSEQLSVIHRNIGIVCQHLSCIAEARSHFHSSLDLLLSLDSKNYIREQVLCQNLAQTYEQTGDWATAKAYFERALDALCRQDSNESFSNKERTYMQEAINRMNEKISSL